MIAKLSGILDSVSQDTLVVDVNGVGYLVHAGSRTLSRIGPVGEPVSLLIDTQVREDAFNLYGFTDQAEQQWFRLLNSVQGVGAKAALAILSVCPPDKLGFAIASGDKPALTQADGVGPKLATRILTELKDKADTVDLSPAASAGAVEGATLAKDEDRGASQSGPAIENDAVSALVNLGYGRSDAFAAVRQVRGKANDNSDLQGLIRMALKELTS